MRQTFYSIDRAQVVPVDRLTAFGFFADAANLEAITPPWLEFAMLTPLPIRMEPGALIDYRLRLHGVPIRWRTRIDVWEPGVRFVDRQVRGPFALWEHTHTFHDHESGTLIRDRVDYRLPLGALGRIARRLLVARDLERIFDYRRDAILGQPIGRG
jgi:ligand-binding SRPBCC domain-containing protein